jgi:hypothetical protein
MALWRQRRRRLAAWLSKYLADFWRVAAGVRRPDAGAAGGAPMAV